MIKFYKLKDPFGCFSNYDKTAFTYKGRLWKSVEHAYQAQKTLDLEEYELVFNAARPNDARNLGQKVTMRKDFDNIKYNIMYECCLAKFSQNENLKEILLSTENHELVEDSPIDYFWGCGANNTGLNNLGKVLMEVRTDLKK